MKPLLLLSLLVMAGSASGQEQEFIVTVPVSTIEPIHVRAKDRLWADVAALHTTVWTAQEWKDCEQRNICNDPQIDCLKTITFHGSSKAIKDIFPEECGEYPSFHVHISLKGSDSIESPVAAPQMTLAPGACVSDGVVQHGINPPLPHCPLADSAAQVWETVRTKKHCPHGATWAVVNSSDYSNEITLQCLKDDYGHWLQDEPAPKADAASPNAMPMIESCCRWSDNSSFWNEPPPCGIKHYLIHPDEKTSWTAPSLIDHPYFIVCDPSVSPEPCHVSLPEPIDVPAVKIPEQRSGIFIISPEHYTCDPPTRILWHDEQALPKWYCHKPQIQGASQ